MMRPFGVLCEAKPAWGRVATVPTVSLPPTPSKNADQNKMSPFLFGSSWKLDLSGCFGPLRLTPFENNR